jgi:fructose-specific phosphotransferase system IIA component
MNLMDILTIDCIRAPLKATSKRGVIDELVDTLYAAKRISEPQLLKDAVWQREQTRTTGLGFGLAIPHGKCAGIPSLGLAIGKPAQPIDFEAIDGKPVKLIVLLASPPERTSDHIQVLAKVSRLMTMEDFRESAYAATSSQELFDLFKSREQP